MKAKGEGLSFKDIQPLLEIIRAISIISKIIQTQMGSYASQDAGQDTVSSTPLRPRPPRSLPLAVQSGEYFMKRHPWRNRPTGQSRSRSRTPPTHTLPRWGYRYSICDTS